MDMKSQDSIQVCIRVRPGNEEESVVQYNDSEIHLDRNHFGFDKIFTPDATQEDIFEAVGTKVLAHTLEGYNACVFVYGQTGSGKTYTMMGEGNGLMQQSFARLFQGIEGLQNTGCSITCSYMQIYNEQLVDLLDTRKEKKLNIRQDSKKGVFVQNLVQETVFSHNKLIQCLNIGMKNRHVGETMMNRESSRSHSIFTISLVMKGQIHGCQVMKTPKLHFVDLAGSERQKMTAASGDRLKQAGSINKSLTTLGMVINALASDKSRTHIPYRDSKLTSLLRDSLGGNSKTYLIATISRSVLCFQETLSTLNFANRAKMVKVKALVNEQSLSTNIETYKQEIRRLKAEISKLKNQKGTPSPVEIIKWRTKVDDNVNYDSQFREINQKISVISEHLVKSPSSPALENLIEQIKKLKPNIESYSTVEQNMVDESRQTQQNQDPLIEYLSCNNTLLQKIHTKIDQYLELKQQIRETAYHNQMVIAQLKTPSKFQRDQYQCLLDARNSEIAQLQSQLKELRCLFAQQETMMKLIQDQSRDKTNMSEDMYQKEKYEMVRELTTLKTLLKQANQEVETMNNKIQELSQQVRENKELYIFAEENYENERRNRDQIESNLMDKMQEIEKITAAHLEEMEEKKEYYEQVEEGLREEVNVLSQTVEFTEHLLAECKAKLESERTNARHWQGKAQELEKLLSRQRSQMEQVQNALKQTQWKVKSMEKQIEKTKTCHQGQVSRLNQQLGRANNICQTKQKQLRQSLESFRLKQCGYQAEIMQQQEQASQQQSMNLENQQKYESYIQQMQQQHQYTRQSDKDMHQQQMQQIGQLLIQKQQIAQQIRNQLNNTASNLMQAQARLQQSEAHVHNLISQHQQQIGRINQETESKLSQVRGLAIENQELKNQYKTLQKQNYKIKAKHSTNNNKTQQELALKVDYYEQKFRLMSIEYQKALDVIKKLKEKELNQAERIVALQESQKMMKASMDSSQNSEVISNLSQENMKLKRQMEQLKSQRVKLDPKQPLANRATSLEQQKKELKQKEEYFRRKIQQSISRWDPSKENLGQDRTLEELIRCWEQLESESCKKLDAITKGIKREQKLKIQNNLILKQNLYLKEQLSSLEREQDHHLGRPRKLVKLDMAQILEEPTQ